MIPMIKVWIHERLSCCKTSQSEMAELCTSDRCCPSRPDEATHKGAVVVFKRWAMWEYLYIRNYLCEAKSIYGELIMSKAMLSTKKWTHAIAVASHFKTLALVWPLLFSLFQSGSGTTAHLYAQTVCNEISARNKWQTMHLEPVSRAVHKRPLCLPNSLAWLRARARTPHIVS